MFLEVVKTEDNIQIENGEKQNKKGKYIPDRSANDQNEKSRETFV